MHVVSLIKHCFTSHYKYFVSFQALNIEDDFLSMQRVWGKFFQTEPASQHRRTENHWKKYICSRCRKVFNRKTILIVICVNIRTKTIIIVKHVQKCSPQWVPWKITYYSIQIKLVEQLKGQVKTLKERIIRKRGWSYWEPRRNSMI